MAREIEIKLRVEDRRALERALKRLGARRASRVRESNKLFDTPRKELRKRQQLLRLRSEYPANGYPPHHSRNSRQVATLTFKGPVAKRKPGQRPKKEWHKVREELESQVADVAAVRKILEALGLREWFRYEKYRTTYHLPQRRRWARALSIDVDETPIGLFVELEGPQRAIDHAAKALGYSRRSYITDDYYALYRDACRRAGQKPGDMLFAGG